VPQHPIIPLRGFDGHFDLLGRIGAEHPLLDVLCLEHRRFAAGPEIKGTVEAGGIDWQLVRPDGVTIIEAHYSLRTDDGALIRVMNKGFRHGPAEVMKRMAQGEPVDPSEYYVRAAPILEAPSGRYGWMNSSLFVSSGVRQPDAVALRFYRVL